MFVYLTLVVCDASVLKFHFLKMQDLIKAVAKAVVVSLIDNESAFGFP